MMPLLAGMPKDWRAAIVDSVREDTLTALAEFLEEERAHHTVFPPETEVFRALELTPLRSVKVVVLGQDPYHGVGQAHGLAFSVPAGVKPPPSLANIQRELESDIGNPVSRGGSLEGWATQGVLLLNAVLTVRAGEANSHGKQGWEKVTNALVSAVDQLPFSVVFLLWGRSARAKKVLVTQERHVVVESSHPSPLSSYRGFFGSCPFSAANHALTEGGREPIDWSIPFSPGDGLPLFSGVAERGGCA
ncbi:MAG: uracil-DNA glycosylase [Lentisphaeria bacterium]|nr:uracil-DNA glycosylase [Lentisphaeria bacterium]